MVAAILVVPAAALGAWAAAAAVPDPTQAGARVAPVVAPVTSAERRPTATVSLEVRRAAGLVAASPTSGTVTATAPVGAVLDDGAEVVRIDDRPLRAMVAAAPLWRSLGPGDQGEDVRRLQDLLVATGHLTATPDGRFGASTARAVTAFARESGAPRGVTTFDPAWVVWVGPEPLRVESVEAPVGAQVGPGGPLLTGPAVASAVAVAEPQGGLGPELGAEAELLVGPVTVPYAVGSGAVTDPAAVAALVTALAPATAGTGRVQASAAVPVLSVPASAVVTGDGGAVCVYPDERSAPVAVTVVGGGASTVQLDPAAGVTAVLVDPGAVDGLAPCG
ncbi:peptidoglycan-binding domain-containing protein [Cellulomonas iranensis]|uniref:peptidoglycan-binding domain-containing protein n=1 Tax=Cellulomonas iranensis TaxID=76862 RepID=UPI0008777809